MWSDNSSNYNCGSNWSCVCQTPYCHTAAMTCLCTHVSNPTNQWYNNVVPNYSTNLLTYQGTDQIPISGFSHVNEPVDPLFHVENGEEVRAQMAKKDSEEIDSWLVLNPDNREDLNSLSSNQIDDCLNLRSYNPWTENQYQGQFSHLQSQEVNHNRNYDMIPIQSSTREGLAEVQQEEQILKFYQEIQHDFSTPANFLDASLPPMGSFSNTIDLPTTEWTPNQFSLVPFHYGGNLIDERVGSHSNSTSISSEGTQLISRTAGSKKPLKLPPLSRQERVQRYFEKKKARKYEKKIQYSSRKTYAQTRPRVRGRFARSSSSDNKTEDVLK
ncbi:hypothetical protein OSB04_004199 [Centaurea solstitialis]|uniref:CCT domain-containing protein n=1 Tax=Centaurea solstitialis TaxID=347529 RepID=A0AA38U3S1_9ASTR|nr:hypothetical protein OSB04_004199 [Centaurea solstitialis]